MPWFRVDDKFHDHPKVRKLRGDKTAAIGLWSLAGSWAADNLTDGFVPGEIVQRFDPKERYARRLVEVGLWTVDEQDGESGYRFHQWTEHQPTRSEVENRRKETRERVKRWRERNGQSKTPPLEVTNGVGNALHGTDVTPLVTPPPTRPDPARPEPEDGYLAGGSPVENNTPENGRSWGSGMPDEWEPHAGHRMLATQRGLDCDHEANQFRAHALDKGRVSQNWHAAFDSWLGRAGVERGGRLRALNGAPQVNRDGTTGRAVEW